MNSTLIFAMGLVMIVVGAGFLYLLFRDNEARWPRDNMEWLGTVLSVLLIVFAIALIVLSRQQVSSDELRREVAATASAFQDMSLEVPAGNFQFQLLGPGQMRDLEAYRGQVVVVNFWATWCAPCLEELPALNRLQETYGEQGLRVVAISDEEPAELTAFRERVPLDVDAAYMPFGVDLPTPFTGAFDVRPTSYIIDRDGVVRRYLLGNRNYGFFEKAVVPYL